MDQRELESLLKEGKRQDDFLRQLKELEEAVRPYLTKDAFERYNRVKLAHPKIAIDTFVHILQMAEKGSMPLIDDRTFKEMLRTITENKKTTRR